jgi:hypothetical protein
MTDTSKRATPGGFPAKEVSPSEMQSQSPSKDRLRRMSGSPPVVSSNARSEFDPNPSNAIAAKVVRTARGIGKPS